MSFTEKNFAKLLQVAKDLSQVRTANQIMDIVKSATRELTGADGATFVLRDGDFCFYADEDAISPLWKGQRFPMKICISGWVMLNREPVVIRDVFEDPRIPADAYRKTFVKSMAMVPVRTAKPIAAIGNYWATHHQPTEDQIHLLQAIAETAAVAIENVGLYSELSTKIKELREANRSKDEFLMTLSHELRTPITAILGWTKLMIDGGLEQEDQKNALKTIYRNANDQLRITEELLDSSEIMTGRLRLHKADLAVDDILRKSLEQIRIASETRGIRWSLAIEHVGTVHADEERLQHVFLSVLENAVKFSPMGARVEVKLDRQGPNACIAVTDMGEGISADFMPYVFDRFSQEDRGSTRRHSGLGLGLSIAKDLLDKHGGRISIQSPGRSKGTSVHITLPLISIS